MTRVLVRDLVSRGVLRVEDGNHGNDRPRPTEFVPDGVAFIRAADMASGVIDFDGAGKIDEVAHRRIRKGVGAPGDVILSHKGTVGRVAVAPPNSPPFVCSPQTTFWRSLDHKVLDQAYLKYVLMSGEFKRQLAILSGQTDMAPYVSLTDQRSLELNIVAAGEQRAIAEILGVLDDKISANDRAADRAGALARAQYRRSVGRVSRSPMSRVLDPVLGGTPSRSDESLWDGAVPWISARDIASARHGIILATAEGISKEASRARRLSPLPAGSVVLTARGTVGKVAVLGVASAINQSCYGFVPDGIPSGCLAFLVEDAARDARSFVHGSVFDTITMRTFDHVSVPSLNQSEWKGIESRVGPLLSITSQLAREMSKLVATRDQLLPLLMSGRLRVRDAERAVEEVV